MIWCNDSFAYLTGKSLGKHKLFPEVSPKKTIEGTVGGIVFSGIAAIFIYQYTHLFSEFYWIIIALFVSLLGTIGDLVQSKFKRLAKVKDSGTILPGHGGIFDRLDSMFYLNPFIVFLLIIIHYVS